MIERAGRRAARPARRTTSGRAYWPTSDEQPFADFINGVRKYVVTSTPLTGDWPQAEAVSGPLAESSRGA